MFETKITRFLDTCGIHYHILPHTEPVFTVEAAATQRGVSREEMVKSILLREKGNRRYVMACILGDARLDTQGVRKHLPGSWRRLSFATREEIQAVTGFVMGAVAPLCLPEGVPIIFDSTISGCDKVNISSGDPMAGLELDPEDLIQSSGAFLAPISHKSE